MQIKSLSLDRSKYFYLFHVILATEKDLFPVQHSATRVSIGSSPYPYALRTESLWPLICFYLQSSEFILNRLTPNDPYMARTAPLTSKSRILYIYSTNIGTEYFKHALYSPFFSLQNAVCFIMLTCLVPVLFTFCIQDVLKLKK